jgi:DNA polymerase-3 subunit delta
VGGATGEAVRVSRWVWCLFLIMPPAKKKAAAKGAGNVHVYVGSDEARVKEAALRMVRKLTPEDAGDFSNDIIEGTADNAEHARQICANVMQALQTLPFFGGEKVVWLKNASFLGDSVTGRAADSVQGFENIVDVLEQQDDPRVRFVLSASAVDKRRGAWKRLSALGAVEVFDKPDTSKAGWEQEVIISTERRARDLGITFESGAIELLVQMAGDDTRQLENELEKIDVFLGERRRAGLNTVRNLVSQSRAGVLWDLGNAIGSRHLPHALELLNTLMYQGQNGIGILLAAIVPRVRSLLMIKDLGAQYRLDGYSYGGFCKSLDKLPPSATVHLPKKKDGSGFNAFPLFLVMKEVGNYSLEELKAGFSVCLDANQKLVTTSLDPKLVLERLLIGILAGRKQVRR